MSAGYFSDSYAEARSKFLSACAAAGAAVDSIRNPCATAGGLPLWTDVASLGPRHAEAALLLISGTHGVEGFCGSAIQNGLLREGAGELGPDIRLVMVHAINPYGFLHLRRANEDNVDLNRNFLDHSRPYARNPGYDKLATAIAPQTLSLSETMSAAIRITVYRRIHGRSALQAAISGGQYHHPDGLFFGGHLEVWSHTTLRLIVDRHLRDASRVGSLDFHTGLGPYGTSEIIVGDPHGSPAYQRARRWWGGAVKSTKEAESVSVHIRHTLSAGLAKMLPAAELTAATLEFGTAPLMQVFWAMRSENWLHHHARADHPQANAIRERMRRVFYPASPEWKETVWSRGREVVAQALSALVRRG